MRSSFLLISFAMLTGCFKEKPITLLDLPKDLMSYIITHYTRTEIKNIAKELDGYKIQYTVYMQNGDKLIFSDGALKEAHSLNGLPNSLFPPYMLDYLQQHYAGYWVSEWLLLKNGRQEIILNNGQKLVFNESFAG